MSTSPTAPAPGGPGTDTGRDAWSAGDPMERRGRTGISDRVLERIATRAVMEVDQAGGAAPRLLGMPLGRDVPEGAPRVDAHVDGHIAIVRVTMSVTYPAPIRRVVHRVRDHIVTRVRELTGLETRQVDIDVARLVHPAEPGRRVR